GTSAVDTAIFILATGDGIQGCSQEYGYYNGMCVQLCYSVNLLQLAFCLLWHPFFITSTPDHNYPSVHIKILGDWTENLKAKFVKVCQPPLNGQSGLLRADCIKEDSQL
ncbi:hypothetical protein S245_014454, partial [Arachis hypogaea]